MKKLLLTIAVAAIMVSGCPDNARARRFGGEISISVPAGEKLVGATWKENQLWYLTRPMQSNETSETFTFREKSQYGYIEGKVVFHESK